MQERIEKTFPVGPSCLSFATEVDPIWCSGRCADLARAIGFDSAVAGAIAIAVSELVTNALKFSDGGTITACPLTSPRAGLEIVVADDAPWVGDVEAAEIDGYSEGRIIDPDDPTHRPRGRGVGLGAVRRLMDELWIESSPGGGVRIVVRKWLH